MTVPVTSPSEPADDPGRVRAEAVAALHLVALRRQFDAIRTICGEEVSHRSREALWAVLEVLLAELRGEPIALRDLVRRAEGLLSAPTLSRVVAELERQGMLASEPAAQGRRKRLRPTARARAILTARTDAAFAEFTAILGAAERKLTAAAAGPPHRAETQD